MVFEENGKDTIDTVQVALRIRPLMHQESAQGCEECISVVSGQQQVQIKDLAFTYNYVFPQHITQQEFYDTAIKCLIGKLFQGYNVTILAYGQTGSGKTYTMGTNYSGSDGDSTKLGVIPQAVADIFDFIEAHQDKYIFKVNVSFMELYQEQCYDLLSTKERGHSIIEIREDINKGVVLPGITELPLTSTLDTMKVLERGSARRVTGSTAMNLESSRSHAVFTIIIYKESRTDKNNATTSKFHLVDLAGSERIKKTKASGERLKEGVKINQGLLALGNVISALGDGTNRSYISYRDSKLTRLLQDSLGGNSLTLMVACVSPADYNLEETVSTLRYADRARRIRNKPIINQDAKSAEILRLNNLVNELRLQLLGKTPVPIEQNNDRLIEELEHERAKYSDLLKKHKKVTENLGMMLIENTNLCEKALLAEAAKEKIERQLNELTEQCNQTIETLNNSQDNCQQEDSPKVVDYLKEIKSRLEDLQSVNLNWNKELIDHEIKFTFVNGDSDDKMDDDEPLSEEHVALEEEKRAMGQVALNKELQELNRAMAIKASVVQAMMASGGGGGGGGGGEPRAQLALHQARQAKLERERDELMALLHLAKTKDATQDERQSKVSQLENEIADLRKKCHHLASIIKTKEKNEAKIVSLNAELQSMKATKVKIIKQMRTESEQFRRWRAESERSVERLRSSQRRQLAECARAALLQRRQHHALRRKMEHAAAVNRRLKDALDRQKECQMKRNAKGNMKAGAVQQYIEQELEVHLSIFEAEKSLEELMEYRAWVTKELDSLRNSSRNNENQKKIAELEDDLALRKAQISDLQQKIVTADHENKCRTQWDNIQSVLEAKVALKCLFEMLLDAKRDLAGQSERGYQAKYEETKEAYDRLVAEFENSKADFERQIAMVKQQSEKKLAALVAIQSGIIKSGEKAEACKHLQNVIQYQQEKLENLEDENRKLTQELVEMRTSPEKSRKRTKNDTKQQLKETAYIEPTDEEDEIEAREKEPDMKSTPMFKRTLMQRLAMDASSADGGQRTRGAKRAGSGACACAGRCGAAGRAGGGGGAGVGGGGGAGGGAECACARAARPCAAPCRCADTCPLRADHYGPRTYAEESTLNGTPSYFDKHGHDSTYFKRRRHYFFPQDNEKTDDIKTD